MISPFAKQKLKAQNPSLNVVDASETAEAIKESEREDLERRVRELERKLESIDIINPFLESVPQHYTFMEHLLNELKPTMAIIADERLPPFSITNQFERIEAQFVSKNDAVNQTIQEERNYTRGLEAGIQELQVNLFQKGRQIYDLKSKLEQKSEKEELSKVEDNIRRIFSRFEDCVGLEAYKQDHQVMYDEINTKCSSEKLTQITEEFHQFQNKTRLQLKATATKEMLHDKVTDLRANIEMQLRQFAPLSALESQKIQIKGIKTQISELEQSLKTSNTIIQSIQQMKADKTELERVESEFVKYSKIEELQDLERRVIPVIEEFREKIEEFRKENDKAKQIIRSFDSVLLEKASKFSVEDVKRNFQYYLTKEEFEEQERDIELKFSRQYLKNEEIVREFKQFNQSISKQIYEAVRRATMKMSKASSLGAGDSISSEQLKALAFQKANKEELEFLANAKSNKIDTESNMRAIDILHNQMTHVIILIVEFLKSTLKAANETQQSRENKKAFLLRQAHNVSQWICRFNPKNVNTYDISHSQELNSFSKYVHQNMSQVSSLAQKPVKMRSESFDKGESRKEGFKLPAQSKEILKKELKFYRKQFREIEDEMRRKQNESISSQSESPRTRLFSQSKLISSSRHQTIDVPSRRQILHSMQEILTLRSKSIVGSRESQRSKIGSLGISRRVELPTSHLPSLQKI